MKKFIFNKNKVGGRAFGSPSTGLDCFEPLLVCLTSAVWDSRKSTKENLDDRKVTTHFLRLNFGVVKYGMDTLENVEICYGMTVNDEFKELNESTTLYNLVPLFGLKDGDNDGFNEEKGVVRDVYFDENIKQVRDGYFERLHDSQLIGKEIGLILFKDYYIKNDVIKEKIKIFDVFRPNDFLLASDVAKCENQDERLKLISKDEQKQWLAEWVENNKQKCNNACLDAKKYSDVRKSKVEEQLQSILA